MDINIYPRTFTQQTKQMKTQKHTYKLNGQTLTYIREAVYRTDGYDGYLFLHSWETGYQYLIMRNVEHALKFLESSAKLQ